MMKYLLLITLIIAGDISFVISTEEQSELASLLHCEQYCRVNYARSCLSSPQSCGRCLSGHTERDGQCLSLDAVKNVNNLYNGEREIDRIQELQQGQGQKETNNAPGVAPSQDQLNKYHVHRVLHVPHHGNRYHLQEVLNAAAFPFRAKPDHQLDILPPQPDRRDEDHLVSVFRPGYKKADPVDDDVDDQLQPLEEEKNLQEVRDGEEEEEPELDGQVDHLAPDVNRILDDIEKQDQEYEEDEEEKLMRTHPKAAAIRQGAASAGAGHNKALHNSVTSMSDVYFLAVVAGCSVAGLVGLVVAGVCWYRLQKNVKAASDVDYPAYGPTDPATKERGGAGSPGDRKLAQSAQMYHYQHQKQQMIALEKANSDMHKDGSDEDTEEENEEGDYTVFECPGLAPTGEMEVKNPLFSEDTPVTPSTGDTKPEHPPK